MQVILNNRYIGDNIIKRLMMANCRYIDNVETSLTFVSTATVLETEQRNVRDKKGGSQLATKKKRKERSVTQRVSGFC